MIVALRLPLNIDTIILSFIFLMLLSDFRTWGLISIPILPIMVLTEFFFTDVETSIHPLPVSWYLISTSLWYYLCSCMHTMSMLWSIADTVSSSSWPILFKVLTLNVTINTWNHLTECKQMSSGLFKNLSTKYVYKSYI